MKPPHLVLRLAGFACMAWAVMPSTTVAQDTAASGTPAAAASAEALPVPIQPRSQCLDPASIQRWDRLGPHSVAVTTRAGDHFGLRFADDCSAGRDKPAAWQMSAEAPARLCGYAGETAIGSEGDMCAIAGIRRLDKSQFDAMVNAGH